MKNYGFMETPNFDEYHGHGDLSSLSGDGEGKTVLLTDYLARVIGSTPEPRDQGSRPTCVGQSTATGADLVLATNIAGLGLPLEFPGRASAYAIYAGSRSEVGYLRYSNRRLLRAAGSHVPYAGEFITEWGVLTEDDLSKYNESQQFEWAYTTEGLPEELEELSKRRSIRSFAVCNNYQDVRGAIYNGYPVVIGSSAGFKGQPKRDKHGMLRRSGTWRHAMVISGWDDASEHPEAGFIWNSWGDRWVGGPKRFDEPEGGFWASVSDIDWIARNGEAIALSGTHGFERRKLAYTLL